jgi:hypothetical protein
VTFASQGRSTLVDRSFSIAFLVALLAYTVGYMWAGLIRSWYFSSDEYVVVAEVIRFAQHTYGQHFFDMPGTPFMFLAALVWFFVYAPCAIFDNSIAEMGIQTFTFAHLPALFFTVRAVTLLMLCASILLLFWLTAKLTSTAAARVAALLLAMSPIYTSYSSFVRVESTAMCLVLGALLCVIYAPEIREHWWSCYADPVWVAGILAGVGAGARLHSMTASLPVLLLLLTFPPRSSVDDYPKWVKTAGIAGAVALIAAALALTFWEELARWPSAYYLFRRAAELAGGALILAFAMYALRPARRLLIRLVPPDVVRVLVGFGVGLVISVPTILSGYEFFFRSVEMYSSTYVDFARARLPLWENIAQYLRSYYTILAPDSIVLYLLIAGMIGILVSRDRRLLAILAGAVLFFVSKPLNLRAEPHHVIMWLPYYAILCAYPAHILERALGRWPASAIAANAAALVAVALWTTHGAELAATNAVRTEVRMGNIAKATNWMKAHAEPKATIAIAYRCFNPDVFYSQLRLYDVPMPPAVLDSRNYIIWWGHASVLKNKAGYACATPFDVDLLKKTVDETAPGEGTDPFTDPRLQRVQTFGDGGDEVDVFQFDNRRSEP